MKHGFATTGVALLLLLVAASHAHAQSIHDLGAHEVALSPPQTTPVGKRALIAAESLPVRQPFNGVLVTGYATDRDSQGWIRFEDGDAWSPWQPLRFVFSATDGTFVAGYRTTTFREDQAFQLEFSVDASARFELRSAGVFDTRDDADAQAAAQAYEPLRPVTPAVTHIKPPRLIRRSAWGAQPFQLGNPVPLARPDYLYITFHHAAGFSAENEAEGKEQVRRIQELHQDVRGWSDIGYQFVVDRAGNLYQGRPFMDESTALKDTPVLAQGAHVGGANTGNIGLCILGCYHPPEGSYCRQELPPAALDSIVTMFAFLCERYGLTPDDIRGHRDFSPTACPGNNNYQLLPKIRERVRDLLEAQAVAGVTNFSGTTEPQQRSQVVLSWTSTFEQDAAYYRIMRRADTDFVEAGRIDARGEGTAYTFTDAVSTCALSLTYRLTAVNTEGDEQNLGAVTVERPPLAQGTLTAAQQDAGVIALEGMLREDRGVTRSWIERTANGRTDTVFVRDIGTPLQALDISAGAPGPTTYRLVTQDAAGCTTVVAEAEVAIEQPRTFVLADNFPNPFNPATTIRYYLDENAFNVRLTIYDAAGREVARLVNDRDLADERWHAVRFDASGLASGVYYYRLQVDGFSGTAFDQTKSLVLVR